MVDPVFREAYRGRPPWDIGRAQPAFVELANEGLVVGRVLDVGCGTGDNALEMAERGHVVVALDAVDRAIDQTAAKARLRGLDLDLVIADALDLDRLRLGKFDTVIDSGLFHGFSDAERELYERGLKAVLKPGGLLHILAISDWEEVFWGGPRRVSQQEIIETFREGWALEDIREARFVTLMPQVRGHCWLATLRREPATVGRKPRTKRANAPSKSGAKPPATRSGGARPRGKVEVPQAR